MNYFIKNTAEFGRGLYASNFIKAGRFICQCEILVLNENDTKALESTALKYYTFTYNASQDCIVLGDGEIFNHSASPNVAYKLEDLDGRKVMVFYALSDIIPGEQLFTDYTADVVVDIEGYIKNASLI